MSSTLVELKQTDSNSIIERNGKYQCTIQDNITLNPGDEIMMKFAAIDSASTDSNMVIIPEDLNVSVGYVRYNYYLDTIPAAAHLFSTFWQPPPSGVPSFETQEVVPGAGDLICTKISVTKEFTGTDNIWGNNQTVTCEYTDWTNDKQLIHFTIPPQDPKQLELVYEFNCNIRLKENSFKDITPSDVIKAAGYQSPAQITTETAIEKNFVLKKYNKTIRIEKGIYTPQDLSAIISEEFQKARKNKFYTGLDDDLYENNLLVRMNNASPANIYQSGALPLLGVNGRNIHSFQVINPRVDDYDQYSGTSQFSLEYDADINKYYFSFLHMPAYDADGKLNLQTKIFNMQGGFADPTKQYDQQYDGAVADIIPESNYFYQAGGGIAFTSLTATKVSDGEIFNFWEEILGFAQNDIILQDKYTELKLNENNDPANTSFINIFLPDVTMLDFGVNTTAPEILLDTVVQKNTDMVEVPASFNVEPSNTTKIYSQNQVQESINNTRFFYIDINAEFQNNLIEQNRTNKHTLAIVSNYYNNQNVTTGSSGDSVIYTHQGSPLKLSSFEVNITDDERQIPNIGPNNYIFIEIINNQPTPNQIMAAEAEKQQKK